MRPKRLASSFSVARIACLAASGAAILLMPAGPGRAAEPLAFIIPIEGGYGIADCMSGGSACGAAMAASWCQAHGHPRVAAFGLADDVTGVTPAAHAVPVDRAAVVIRCDD